ncbi:MAG: cation-efflux pump [Pseudomonadota bacterium]|nr:cation-efflux pump [Pseudomonadota bacterium]
MTLKERTAVISLVASLVLAGVKLVIGLAIGSLALITDALHSGVDFLATGMTWAAVRWGDRPPDASHPYGHGKFENVAALAEATLLLLLAGGVMVAATSRIRTGDEPPALSWIAVAALLVEIGVNTWRAGELKRVGRATQSAALEADSLHFASDVFSSFAVLGGFGLVALGYWWGDAAAAIAVAVLIAVLALRLLFQTVNALVDRAPEGVANIVSERVGAVAGVLGVANVRLRSVGPRHFVELTIQAPRSLGLEQAAEVKANVVEAVRAVLPGAEVAVQSVPCSPSDETVLDRVLLVALRERVAVHHVTVQHVDEQLALALDLEVDGALPLAEAHAIADRLEAAICREFGASTEIEIHIEPLEPEVTDAVEASGVLRASYIAALEDAAREIDGLSDVHDVRLRQSGRGYVLVAHCRLDPSGTVESVHRRVDDLERLVKLRLPEIARIVIHAEPARAG